MQKFGEKLRALRKQRGLTLRALAAALNIRALSYISRIETGKKKPSTEFIIAVSRLFEVPVDKLVKDELELDDDVTDD